MIAFYGHAIQKLPLQGAGGLRLKLQWAQPAHILPDKVLPVL